MRIEQGGRLHYQYLKAPSARQHGAWTCRKNCALTAAYHPLAILRDPSKYEIVKKDFQEIVRKRAELGGG
ncbi:MAG: hypothetical protein HFI92_00650 [Lachnospiraceae bacterium]|nr:hypothetical protein [Lachnospiraceae bacterium]